MPVKPGALDQAHGGSGSLAGAQRAGKQRVRAAYGQGPDLAFHPIVGDRQLPIFHETR